MDNLKNEKGFLHETKKVIGYIIKKIIQDIITFL